MRRTWILVSVLTFMTVPAVALGQQDLPFEPVHLALGDSVAFGVGTPNEEKLGYSAVLDRWVRSDDCREGPAAACPGLDLVNLAVPGATSSSLINDQLQPALQLIGVRNSDGDPANDVVLITMTIGGNDLFNPVVGTCSGGVTPACLQVIQSVFATYSQNLALILGSLRTAAGPDTQIVIMTYYNPLGACHLAALEPLADVVLEGDGGGLVGFNDIIRGTAAAFDVDVANTFGQLDVDDFVGGQDCLHPDISGYRKIAAIFRAATG